MNMVVWIVLVSI